MKTSFGWTCLMIAAIAGPAWGAAADSAAWTDAAGRRNGRVSANGTTLHYVDHGGDGPALVFLAGLGNSAHVFDDFAPRFADSFRVLAFTRRGYGESGRPKDGYDTGTLAEDVRALFDSLGVENAVLVGHSVAGDELTEFAARYPDRVRGLVYLDAAYDRSHTTRRLIVMAALGQIPPAPPGPSGKDRASIRDARDYFERIYGVRWQESEIVATRVFDPRGRWRRDATPASVNAKIIQGERAPRYREVRSPVLAIYAVRRGENRDFPWIRRLFVGQGAARLKANRFRAAQDRWEAGERRRLREEVPSARIVELGDASHYLFLSNPDQVEHELRAFFTESRSGLLPHRPDRVGTNRSAGTPGEFYRAVATPGFLPNFWVA